MMTKVQSLVCAALMSLALLAGSRALAEEVPANSGIFLDDSWRYERPTSAWGWVGSLAKRTVSDLVAIPANVDRSEPASLLTILAVTSVSIAATMPVAGRSLDARIQDEIHRLRGVNCAYLVRESDYCQPPKPSGFHVWNKTTNDIFITTILSTPVALLVGGALAGNPQLVEASTLAIESFAVAQIYHLSLKLFTGREGPLWHGGAGEMHGPSISYFPDGWPSGHAATFFSLAAAYSAYFKIPWLRVLLLGTATVLATMLIADDAHYTSDVLLGGVIGYFVGTWVVEHRASVKHKATDTALRLTAMAPLTIDRGYGIAARIEF